MNDDVTGRRLKDVEDNIKQDFDVLKGYEDALRYEIEPRLITKYNREIERQRESLAHNQKELDELKKHISLPEIQKVADLLKQQETKLDAIQKQVNQNVSGVGTTAGGEVTFGDIRGQVPVGENITQTVYKESVFVEESTKRLDDREKVTKPAVFISYSHKDENWKEKLVTHLAVLQQEGILSLWEDRQIIAGEDWYQKIQQAIETAKVAILLVSAEFLTSNFIQNKEVPRLLERRDREGLWILPLILKPCVWDEVKWLARMQVRPKDGKPIISGDENQIETNLATFAKEVITIIRRASKEEIGNAHASSNELKSDQITVKLEITAKLEQLKRWSDAGIIAAPVAIEGQRELVHRYIRGEESNVQQ